MMNSYDTIDELLSKQNLAHNVAKDVCQDIMEQLFEDRTWTKDEEEDEEWFYEAERLLNEYVDDLKVAQCDDIINSFGLMSAMELLEDDRMETVRSPRLSHILAYNVMYHLVMPKVRDAMEQHFADCEESEVCEDTFREKEAYDIGLEIWLRIGLNRCFPTVKEHMLKSVPGFMEHYAKEEGFGSMEVASRVFNVLMDHIKLNNPEKMLLNSLMTYCPERTELIQTILKEKPLP